MTTSLYTKIEQKLHSACAWIVCGIACSLLLVLPQIAAAQMLPNTGQTTITLNPSTPMPGMEFVARVDAYSYDMERASIAWSVNGEPLTDAVNAREVRLTAPTLGAVQTIVARVTDAGGGVHTATYTVIPGALDIIVEGTTRVPYFYHGGPLPSPGSQVRLIAVPTLYTASGTLVPANNVVYTWRSGQTVLASGVGQRTLTTTMPQAGSFDITVSAEALDGSASHTASEIVESANPIVVFYEDNPLFGVARTALPPEFTLIDEEVSVRAEPYFVAENIFSNAQYSWKLNNSSVENPNADPQVLTLRRTGGAGQAQVSFDIRNLSALLQAAVGRFTVYFE